MPGRFPENEYIFVSLSHISRQAFWKTYYILLEYQIHVIEIKLFSFFFRVATLEGAITWPRPWVSCVAKALFRHASGLVRAAFK